jgi:hypothetical protein
VCEVIVNQHVKTENTTAATALRIRMNNNNMAVTIMIVRRRR